MSYSSSFFDNEHVFIWITTKSAESEANDAFFSVCLLRCSFNSPFEMLKYKIACVTAPGMDCAELTPYSELHFEGT